MSGIRIEDKPPSLAKGFTLPKTSDLPSTRKPWKYVKLPIDIMLLTVKDCEFLSCYNLLKNSFKSYTKKLGDVYFGGIGTGEPLKVALMKCQEGAIAPNGPIIVVQNAVTILQPKAVITVGYCSGLQRCTTRLGDVVVCSKITQYGPRIFQRGEVQSIGAARVPLSRDMLQLIREADAGWNPPLLDPSLREIKVHKDAEYLSGPEVVFDKQRYDELTRLYSNAKAIDMEGEGVYVAAYDLKIEWVVVKGISGYADGIGEVSDEWKTFASVMAASVVEKMLDDSVVFESWPHYKEASDLSTSEPAVARLPSVGSPGIERPEVIITMDNRGNLGESIREPPELSKTLKVLEMKDLPPKTTPWKDIEETFLPVDFLLLTAKKREHLSCLSHLSNIEMGNDHKLGPVHFGFNSSNLKIAVIKCYMGAGGPGGSTVVVQEAVPILRPKAVVCVGYCASMGEKKAKLGDVIVSAKLITNPLTKVTKDGYVVPPSTNMAKRIKVAEAGWEAPLKSAEDLKVEVHDEGVLLSGPNVLDNPELLKELNERFPQGTAIEMEGEGLYAAAHNHGIEWLVIKGVSDFGDGSKSSTDSWRLFASVMAASLVAHMLNDSNAFEKWRHYENSSDVEDGSTRKRQRSSSFSGSDPKRNKVTAGESYAEDAQPGPSNQGEPRSTRAGDKAPTTYKASVKAGVPSDGELEHLSLELGDQWERLGGRLGFNQAAITCFDRDYRGLNRKAFKMLIAWRRKEGADATYKVLYDALCDKRVQCKELAQQFCCD